MFCYMEFVNSPTSLLRFLKTPGKDSKKNTVPFPLLVISVLMAGYSGSCSPQFLENSLLLRPSLIFLFLSSFLSSVSSLPEVDLAHLEEVVDGKIRMEVTGFCFAGGCDRYLFYPPSFIKEVTIFVDNMR